MSDNDQSSWTPDDQKSFRDMLAKTDAAMSAIDNVQKATISFCRQTIPFSRDAQKEGAREYGFLAKNDLMSFLNPNVLSFLKALPVMFEDLPPECASVENLLDKQRAIANIKKFAQNLDNLFKKGNKEHIAEIWNDLTNTNYTLDEKSYCGTLQYLYRLSAKMVEPYKNCWDQIPPKLAFLEHGLACSYLIHLYSSLKLPLENNSVALGLSKTSGQRPPPPR